MFVPRKPFQPIILFECKATAYPSKVPFRSSTLGYVILTDFYRVQTLELFSFILSNFTAELERLN